MKRSLNTDIPIETNLERVLVRHHYIIDATPAPDVINVDHITQDTFVAAPGVPAGLSPEAALKLSGRFLHDPLQIGVATMIVEAVSP